MPKVTEALVGRGWKEEQVRAYLGGNLKRVLDRIWSAGRTWDIGTNSSFRP